MCVCLASSCSLVCVSCQAMNDIISKLRSKCTYLNEMFVCATPSCHVMLAFHKTALHVCKGFPENISLCVPLFPRSA